MNINPFFSPHLFCFSRILLGPIFDSSSNKRRRLFFSGLGSFPALRRRAQFRGFARKDIRKPESEWNSPSCGDRCAVRALSVQSGKVSPLLHCRSKVFFYPSPSFIFLHQASFCDGYSAESIIKAIYRVICILSSGKPLKFHFPRSKKTAPLSMQNKVFLPGAQFNIFFRSVSSIQVPERRREKDTKSQDRYFFLLWWEKKTKP